MDTFSKRKRSWIMSQIKSKDTNPERNLLKIARENFLKKGYRYKRNYKKLEGKPDIVFVKERVALFADGDFWHGYNFRKLKNKLPKKYWLAKIEGNIKRDEKINKQLKKEGWKILRFWEHEIKKNPAKTLSKIEKYLSKK